VNHSPSNVPGATTRGAIVSTYKRGIVNTHPQEGVLLRTGSGLVSYLWMQELREGSTLMGNALRILLRQTADEATDDLDGPSTSGRTARSGSTAAGSIVDLLTAAPHCVPYTLRVELFRELLALEKKGNGWPEDGGRPLRSQRVCVNRVRILEDSLLQLLPLGARIKSPLSVTYIDEHGLQEAGVCILRCGTTTAATRAVEGSHSIGEEYADCPSASVLLPDSIISLCILKVRCRHAAS
jgi:hypothetical protein